MHARLSLFEFSQFIGCRIVKSHILAASFAGSVFRNTKFTGSELVHTNLCGVSAKNALFDDTDLYNSRFIRAQLFDVSFHGANIQNTVFYGIVQKNITFKSSNAGHAFFSEGVTITKNEVSFPAGEILI
jgi:uncharacterized protein YjbI with pentapeptide repeats